MLRQPIRGQIVDKMTPEKLSTIYGITKWFTLS